jgi:LysR family glycine cleavage system transcriptional activator
VDFARSDFHVAIRLGTGDYPGVRCEKFLDEYLVAVASPAVFAKYGPLADAADLAKLPLLHGDEIDWGNWYAGNTDSPTRLRGAFIDDSAGLLSAAVEGVGFGILRWTLAVGELQAGRLVLASKRVTRHRFAYYFVCPEAYMAFPKVVALRDWLVQQARQFPAPPTLSETP